MLTLTNPIMGNVQKSLSIPTQDAVQRGAFAAGGLATGKVGQTMVGGPLLQMIERQGILNALSPQMRAAVLATLGGFAGLVTTRFLASTAEEFGWASSEQGQAMVLGAWVNMLNPLLRMAIVNFMPAGAMKQAMLAGPNQYMVPVGGEYATEMMSLGNYAPGDFGDDASPNYPALAGVAPQFDGVPSEYDAAALGAFMPEVY